MTKHSTAQGGIIRESIEDKWLNTLHDMQRNLHFCSEESHLWVQVRGESGVEDIES